MRKKELPSSYISALCMELYLAVQSGLQIEEGLEMLLEEEQDARARENLRVVRDAVSSGQPLHEGLLAAGCFPDYMVDLTRIGAQTGNLDRVLKSLSDYYDRQAQTAASVRSAVVYPLVLLGILLFVVLVLVIKVLPIFADVYRQLGTVMSGAAEAILRCGMAISENWIPIASVTAALALAIFILLRIPATRRGLKRMAMPAALRMEIARERFASALSMAMASGFDVDEAIGMAYELCGDDAMREKIDVCRAQLKEGAGLADALRNAEIVTGLSARTLAMGMKTGSADAVLAQIAEKFQNSVHTRTAQLIGRLEPTLVIVMSVLVGVILISVMLPLVGILSSLG